MEALEEKNKVGEFMLSDFKPYYKAVKIKIAYYWNENRNIY